MKEAVAAAVKRALAAVKSAKEAKGKGTLSKRK